MTTATIPQAAATRPKPAGYPNTALLSIPLSEFGKSLSDSDLDAWFEAFGERNADFGQYEISKSGELLIMPPTGHPGVLHELTFAGELYIWTGDHDGFAFPPTARFILPDGSRLGPDAAWVREERRDELAAEHNRPFPHIVPDFIAEVQSPSNDRDELVEKIGRFIAYGTRLAWLIDAGERVVIMFRPGQEPETLYDPEFADGDDNVLPGFRFAVREKIFDYFTNPQPQTR